MVSTKLIPRYLDAFLPPTLWAAMIFFLSSQSVLPGFDASIADFLLKKTAHMGVYAVLYFLLWRAIQLTSHTKATTKHWVVPFLLVIGYASVDELHQSFVPGRYVTARDIGYDLLGAGIAFLRIYGYL